MLTRFTNIINELVSLGRQIPTDKQVRKVLRSLPQDERWRAKVTALQETKVFKNFNIEQLAGSLMTHELHLGFNNEPTRIKGLALKADEEEDSKVDEDEAALIITLSETVPFGKMIKGKERLRNREEKNSAKHSIKVRHKEANDNSLGDSESEEEDDDQPEQETANLYICLEKEEFFRDTCVKLNKCEKPLKVCKEHGAWLETAYANSSSSSRDQLLKFNVDSENLKNELSTLKTQKDQLESELNARKDRSIDPKVIPEWIAEAQGKRTEGLGYMTKRKGKQKKYVELPSMKVCTFCGKTGHLYGYCRIREEADKRNVLVRGNNSWYLDNGCSKHMTGYKSKFLSLEDYPGGTVTFGDNKKGEIIGKCKIGRSKSHSIDNVFLVEGLMHNLLSISQFCDKGNYVSFTYDSCNIINNKSGKHKRFGHASFSLLDKLRSRNLAVGLPIIKFLQNKVCDACVKGKHVHSSFKLKKMVGKKYVLVIVDDYSIFTWVIFPASKDETFNEENGMNHNFSAPRTPQQNGVGRKQSISHLRAFSCKCFVNNNGKKNLGKCDERSEEAIFIGYASDSKAYRVYNKSSMCVKESIHIIFDEVNQFVSVQEQEDDNDFEIGLIRDRDEEENQKQTKEKQPSPEENHQENGEVPQPDEQVNEEQVEEVGGTETEAPQIGVPDREFQPRPFKYQGSHPTDLIISDIGKGTQTISQMRNYCAFHTFLSILEPRNHQEALRDADWIVVMQEELNEFERNKVWHLEPNPKGKKVIGLKWVFRNKLD
ncbi:uncharacterized protein LOC110694897 [Chenopodium quinoa]|uniref:uncharacterized protein LOC110694897 n=1 Tax=Chenopodium quinoa TaxID=63459 RepID=UPI000B776CEB|nr:uncharacterized protein LOC110694897 [Chenopodium quinoa]